MTKNIFWKIAFISIAISVIFTAIPVSADTLRIPSTIKVGLFYKDSYINTALPFFNVSAAAGMQIGFSNDNNFTEMYREPGASTLYVRKDTYFYTDNGALKEFNPADTAAASPTSPQKYGPYHIKIGNDYSDLLSAETQAAVYRQAGIQVFIAYADAWQIWTGSYLDEAAALNDTANLKTALGEIVFTVMQPEANRIMLVNSQFQPLCAFGSNTAYFQIKPAPENNPAIINIKGKPYRGTLEVRRLAASDMTVINVVTMQEYLYGNVPAEIGGRAPAEAIKAQAISSKMYAINSLGKYSRLGFDLCPTTLCQVYKGYSVENPDANKAMDEVKDKIITYDGKPARQIYYFASSGGRTEDVRNVWGSSYPYLVSVEDKYEKIYTWTKTLRASDVRAKLPQLGNILGISIIGTAESGRVTQLAVSGVNRSEPVVYSREKTRTIFSLKSQLYTITTDADVYTAAMAYPSTVTANAAVTNGIVVSAQDNSDAVAPAPAANNMYTETAAASDENDTVTGSAINSLVKLPINTSPVKTQLGGKKVITASGVVSLNDPNKKITILGADNKVIKTPMVPETYTFTGKGWGHAVGMSQEGAIGMGKAGFKYDEILTHYFTGTKIE